MKLNKINNLADYASKHDYVVAKNVEGDWWFWGAYDTIERALESCTDEYDRYPKVIIDNRQRG